MQAPMKAPMKARVRNGHVVADEPAELPEGTEIEIAFTRVVDSLPGLVPLNALSSSKSSRKAVATSRAAITWTRGKIRDAASGEAVNVRLSKHAQRAIERHRCTRAQAPDHSRQQKSNPPGSSRNTPSALGEYPAMSKGVVGIHGTWIFALTGALSLAVACGDDDKPPTPPHSTGGTAGKAGGAGKGGTAGETTGGSAGTSAGKGGKGGTGGDAGGGPKGGSGGTGGSKGGSGGTTGGTGGTGGSMMPMGGEGGDSGAGAGGDSGAGTGGTGVGGTGGTGQAGQGGEGGEPPVQAGAGGEDAFGGQGGAPVDLGPNLFFSEYVEASGTTNPDAVEIINQDGAAVNLGGCSVLVYANGSATATGTVALTGTITNNDVFVVCTSAIGTSCDQNAAALNFSGDDAVELRCGTNTLDVIGRIGTDPGTEWGTGNTTTLNHTLRRLCSVTTGDRDGSNGFGPAQQWAGLAVDTVSGLGSATCAN